MFPITTYSVRKLGTAGDWLQTAVLEHSCSGHSAVDGNSDVLYNIETEFLENLLQENVGSCK